MYTEGEKDADALNSIGLTATTNPGGAGKWRDEYAESLRGVGRVYICYDIDKPDPKTGLRPGEVHALAVAKSIAPVVGGIEFRCAVVGKDVSDHLAAGKAVEELSNARPVAVPKSADEGPENGPRERSGAKSRSKEPAVYQLALERLREHARGNNLPMPRKTDNGWEACCPAHDDHRPSLGIRVGDEQPLVLDCQAGCEFEDVLTALRIPLSEAFEKRRMSRASGGLSLHTPGELAKKPKPTTPLIRGVVAEGSYGPFGGKEKTLKSICAYAGAIALVSGKPMLGFERWSVPQARTALIFAGEGGIELAQRRLQRIASDIYGIDDISTIPLYVMEGTAELNGEHFQSKTMEFVAQYGKPGLVILDALYNFHDVDVEVSNLYARGRMLSDYQHFMARECGLAALWVVDHFRKSANTTGLDEYMQSGMAQWADSWWNAEHRLDPDVSEHRFWLKVEIGSRHGYGGVYEIDIDEGPFDDEAMVWERPTTVTVRRSNHTAGDVKTSSVEDVLEIVGEKDGIVTRDLERKVGGRYPKRVIGSAITAGFVVIEKGARSAHHHHLTEAGKRERERLRAAHHVSLSRNDGS